LAATALAIPKMMLLDRKTRSSHVTRGASLDGTLGWLLQAQDATPDGGVSTGYAVGRGWLKSYPETTGYIMPTLLRHHELFGGDELVDRVHRMARWEVDVQWDEGGIPGSWRTPAETPVVFNTGQVLMGWAAWIRRENNPEIRDAAARAAAWTIGCMAPDGHFEGGVSPASAHGRLSHNAMVSWGLVELGQALGDDAVVAAGVRSAEHYASTVDEDAWPAAAGIDEWEKDKPLTHAVGYTIQGILETGLLADRPDLVDVAIRMLRAAVTTMDPDSGFVPGRIHRAWRTGPGWACLTGTAQIAGCILRLVLDGRETDLRPHAERMVDHVVSTQLDRPVHGAPPFGVRGSFPFRFDGYCRATFVNWAAKFHLDTLHQLHELEAKG
jgi:hypothetical protein